MVDLFISYARPDRRLAERLCDDLTARGLAVWWDRELLSGEEFRFTILARLREAKAVLVIWTMRSIRSRWVCEEAEEAAELGKLVASCEDGFDMHELPLGFRSFQTVPLSDRAGIVAAVAAMMARGAGADAPAPLIASRRRARFGGRRRALAAAAAAAAFASAAAAAFLIYPTFATSDIGTSDIVLGDTDWGPRQRQLIALGRRLESEFQAATDLQSPPLSRAALARPLATVEEIRALDANNGHVQFFTGAIARWMDRPGIPSDASHQAYFRYLELAEAVGGSVARTGPGSRWCYDRPWGICTERTAWINHQLAWDYYRWAAAGDPARRRLYYQRAQRYAREAIRLFPGGFDQGLPTHAIEQKSAEGTAEKP